MRFIAILATLVLAGSAAAQYPPPPRPAVVLGAPIFTDAPPKPFVGARYSFYEPNGPCPSFPYYAPGYTAPQFYNPRYPNPGPYYYSPGYPYSSSYYSYYFTPGFFRY